MTSLPDSEARGRKSRRLTLRNHWHATGPAHEMAEGVSWLIAIVIGRVLAEAGTSPPEVTDHAILLVKRDNVMVGDGCTPGDAGMLSDAMPADASVDAALVDGGVSDASVPSDAGCTTLPGSTITLVVQPHVSVAIRARFAVLLVTPSRPVVETQYDILKTLAEITGPIQEVHEVEVADPQLGTRCAGGCGAGARSYTVSPDMDWEPPAFGDGGIGDGGLVIENIGPYEIVRAEPTSPEQLTSWLDQLGYLYSQDDLDAVAPYIKRGYSIVAVRIAIDKNFDGELVPIALTWQGDELRIPAALGRSEALTSDPLTVFIAASGRYDLAGAWIRYANRTDIGKMGFLTRNELYLDQTRSPDEDPIARKAPNDVELQEIERVTKEVPVPVEVYCDNDVGCCSDCSTRPQRTRFDLGLIVIAVAFVLRRRRRRSR